MLGKSFDHVMSSSSIDWIQLPPSPPPPLLEFSIGQSMPLGSLDLRLQSDLVDPKPSYVWIMVIMKLELDGP